MDIIKFHRDKKLEIHKRFYSFGEVAHSSSWVIA